MNTIAVAAEVIVNNTNSVGSSGLLYKRVGNPVPELAQVVVFYPHGSTAAAGIYIDRELQSALLPGEFTVMCLASGAHTVESYINDFPLYDGKRTPVRKLTANGGETYFIQVNNQGQSNTAALVAPEEAEFILAKLTKHSRIMNRASQVKVCQYQERSVSPILLQKSIYFDFSRSDEKGISINSRPILADVVKFIKNARSIEQIHLVGYTDAVGSSVFNQRLSEARAATINRLLISEGVAVPIVSTVGMGIAPSAAKCSSKDVCSMNSRRVEIMVKGTEI
ncbi:MAG: OmpA family protein [Aeromonas veronii]